MTARVRVWISVWITVLQNNNNKPVSYTHLDVYKRQTIVCGLRRSNLFNFWGNLIVSTCKPTSRSNIPLKTEDYHYCCDWISDKLDSRIVDHNLEDILQFLHLKWKLKSSWCRCSFTNNLVLLMILSI